MRLGRIVFWFVLAGPLGCTNASDSRWPQGDAIALGAGPRVFFTAEPQGMFLARDLTGRAVVPTRDGAVAVLGGPLEPPTEARPWRDEPTFAGIPSRFESTRRVAYLAGENGGLREVEHRRVLYEIRGPVHQVSISDEALQSADPSTPLITSVLFAQTRRCRFEFEREPACESHDGDFAVVVDAGRAPSGVVSVARGQEAWEVRARMLPSTTVYVWRFGLGPPRLVWRSTPEEARAALAAMSEVGPFEMLGSLDVQADFGVEVARLLATFVSGDAPAPRPEALVSHEAWTAYIAGLPPGASASRPARVAGRQADL